MTQVTKKNTRKKFTLHEVKRAMKALKSHKNEGLDEMRNS